MGLSGNSTAIQDLEAEIDRISASIQDLNDKQRSLQTQRNSKLPFFDLAPETCLAIFSFACHKGRLPLRGRERVTTPFVISSVCHAWRVMARSAPELWSSVSLCVDPSTEGSEIQAKLLYQWLLLAKGMPLSISIIFDEKELHRWNFDFRHPGFILLDGRMTIGGLPTAVISVAAFYSHQWESLDIFLPMTWARTLQLAMGRIPNLKSLHLQYVPYNNSAASLFTKTFLDAPKLRAVTLNCENMDIELPRHQFEELSILGYNTAARLAFLRKSPNLTFCRISEQKRGEVHPSSQHVQHTPVHLSKLISLEITDSQEPSLLNYIVAPALESVTISMKENFQIQAFSNFLTRSNAVLRRLTIVDDIPREEDFLRLLETLPHLSYLELDEFDSSPPSSRLPNGPTWLKPSWLGPSRKFFEFLRKPITISGGLPLPVLTTFKYRGQIIFEPFGSVRNEGEDEGFDIDALEKTLLARWNAHPSSCGALQLRVFSMSIIASPKATTEIEQSSVIKGLLKEGMHLMFKSVEPRSCSRNATYR